MTALTTAPLETTTQAAVDLPHIKKRLTDIGVTGVAADRRSPEYLAKYIAEEVARWEGDLQDQKRALEAQAQQAANMQQEAAAKHSQLEVGAHISIH